VTLIEEVFGDEEVGEDVQGDEDDVEEEEDEKLEESSARRKEPSSETAHCKINVLLCFVYLV
jgi:hypothetical protein